MISSIYLIEVVDIFFFLYYVAAEIFSKLLEFVCHPRVNGERNLLKSNMFLSSSVGRAGGC